ncbi:MAG: hypothetical protein NZO16_07855, partial [Deltaproteobacteria bacterium]|nr:hypothetical protein [Deltaproteobacteria bacterium]
LVLKSKERSSKLANFARDLSGMGQFNFNNQHTKSDHELHFDKNSNSLQTFSEGLKLPLGEINLLNTKSYRFADFIIRVAKGVFFQTVTEVQSKPQAFVGNFNEQFTAKYNTLGEIVEITSSKSELSQKLESIIGRYGKDSNPPLELFRNSEFLYFVFLFEIKNQKLGDSHRFYIRLTAGIP